MSKLLVLDYSNNPHQADWLKQLFSTADCELRGCVENSANDDHNSRDCNAILVVDNGDQNGAAALRSAFSMRHRDPKLSIAVITPLAAQAPTESTAMSRPEAEYSGLCRDRSQPDAFLSLSQARRMLTEAEPKNIEMRVSNDAVLFEYQGV